MDILKIELPDYEKVSDVGFLKQYSVKETTPLHTHDQFYEVFYIQKGKAVHKVNGEHQLLSKGSFVLIRPDDIHLYEFFNNYDIEIISCGISVELIEAACVLLRISTKKLEESKLPLHVILKGYQFDDIERKLIDISKKKQGDERRQYFLSILPQFLYIFLNNRKYELDIIPLWLSDLIVKMNERENFIEGLPRLIKISNKSQAHLTREFKKYLKMTPTEYINLKRMNYVIELLLERKYEIIDICYMSGYNSLSYFYRIFAKHFNCSPKQFVKNI